MPGKDAILRGGTAVLATAAALALAGCGDDARQDAGEHRATYTVAITDASFPPRQRLAEGTTMRITVRNVDSRTIPNLAATVEAEGEGSRTEAFATRSPEPDLASRSRPAWIVDAPPARGETAHPNTWALGPLPPDGEATFTWRVTAVRPGSYRLGYRLAGSLSGASRLVLPDGRPASGRFAVSVTRAPRQARVTEGGDVVSAPAR